MSVEVAIWRMTDTLRQLQFSRMERESILEQVLSDDITIIDPSLLLIGRQVLTTFGKYVDLLALDPEGNVVVIELKRSRTPREVVAQLLDYGCWVCSLTGEDLARIFDDFVAKYRPNHSSESLDKAFCERFQVQEMPDPLNESHKLVVVAGTLDDSTERIITYLADEHGVAINAVFFRFFRDDDREYLTRAWLIDPSEVEAKVEEKREKLPWNGEFYVSYGGNPKRDWEEARKYGFISAGGGSWYTKSLGMLEPDARIWVNTPGHGYVGVGRVTDEQQPIDEFLVNDGNGKQVPITQLPLKAATLTTMAQDPDKAEQMVRVEWIKTVPVHEAIREKGFFGNQNSVAKPRTHKWRHTIERLKTRFEISD